jgi:dipeptidase E
MSERTDPRRILAMGGGGFTMPEHDQSDALDRLILDLTATNCPKICFLPTASGDERASITRFYERFSGWPCEPSVLSLFTLGRDRVDPAAHILAQDAIYVGGGSLRNMLAIWREHAIDAALRTAWERGVVLAGLSAGAMCWFEGGVSMSGGRPQVVNGLGLLPGSLSVHMDGEAERLPAYADAVGRGQLPAGYAADDGAALIFHGNNLRECVASRDDARVLLLSADGEGGVTDQALPVRLLPYARRHDVAGPIHEPYGVSEMRALRGGRHRWD